VDSLCSRWGSSQGGSVRERTLDTCSLTRIPTGSNADGHGKPARVPGKFRAMADQSSPPDDEAHRTPAVRHQPPPESFLRIFNPLARLIVRTPVGRLVPWMGVLRFAGRKTARRFVVPVGVHDVDGVATVFTDRPWKLNFRDGARVVVVRAGRQRQGDAVLIDDPAKVGVALLNALQHTSRPSNLALKITKGRQPTADDLAALGNSMIQIRFDA